MSIYLFFQHSDEGQSAVFFIVIKTVADDELVGNDPSDVVGSEIDDASVRLVKHYKMEESCVLVSLKYDLIDYYHIDPAFGTDEEFGELVKKAHEKKGLQRDFIPLKKSA